MNIRNIRQIHATASQRLDQAQYKKQIILIYAGISIGLSALVTCSSYFLSNQISQTGGLRNMGIRSILSTFHTVLPILQNLVLMCLELGFLNAMIRLSKGLYTSPQSLRAGLPRFGAAIRCTLILSFRYLITGMLCFYLALMIFGFTPLSNRASELLMPIAQQMSVLNSQVVIEEAIAAELADAMVPFFLMFAVVLLVVMVPMVYRYRLANYILMDKPAYGAMAALTESRVLMRRNCFALFKLDLSLWWYYLLSWIVLALCYGDILLTLLGIALPWSDTFGYFLFYGLYLIFQFAIYYFFGNRVGVTYALAYEALKPREEESQGVVLGNIFQT